MVCPQPTGVPGPRRASGQALNHWSYRKTPTKKPRCVPNSIPPKRRGKQHPTAQGGIPDASSRPAGAWTAAAAPSPLSSAAPIPSRSSASPGGSAGCWHRPPRWTPAARCLLCSPSPRWLGGPGRRSSAPARGGQTLDTSPKRPARSRGSNQLKPFMRNRILPRERAKSVSGVGKHSRGALRARPRSLLGRR